MSMKASARKLEPLPGQLGLFEEDADLGTEPLESAEQLLEQAHRPRPKRSKQLDLFKEKPEFETWSDDDPGYVPSGTYLCAVRSPEVSDVCEPWTDPPRKLYKRENGHVVSFVSEPKKCSFNVVSFDLVPLVAQADVQEPVWDSVCFPAHPVHISFNISQGLSDPRWPELYKDERLQLVDFLKQLGIKRNARTWEETIKDAELRQIYAAVQRRCGTPRRGKSPSRWYRYELIGTGEVPIEMQARADDLLAVMDLEYKVRKDRLRIWARPCPEPRPSLAQIVAWEIKCRLEHPERLPYYDFSRAGEDTLEHNISVAPRPCRSRPQG
jgi:hypothetical protein